MPSVCGTLAESVGSWSTFFLAWLGLFAFFGTIYGISQSRREAKRARTLDYMRRLDDKTSLNTQVVAFLLTGDTNVFNPGETLTKNNEPSAHEVMDAFGELDIETQARLILLFNFYEELSCSYSEELLDERVAKKMLAPHIQSGWEGARDFVELWRERTQTKYAGQNPNVEVAERFLNEWETLAEELKKRQESKQSAPNPPPRARRVAAGWPWSR